jgi:hypothetical protein
MEREITIDSAYIASEDVVAREIEGEFILVPLASGIGDMEDEIYTLNETALKTEFEARPGEIEEDIAGLVNVFFERKMVVLA